MPINSQFVSNETDESAQSEKHLEQRIWTWRGIVTALISAYPNAPGPILMTSSVTVSEGKKAEEGTMTSSLQLESTPVAVTDRQRRKLWHLRRPNELHPFWEGTQNLRAMFGRTTCVSFLSFSGDGTALRLISFHFLSFLLILIQTFVLVREFCPSAAADHLIWAAEDGFKSWAADPEFPTVILFISIWSRLSSSFLIQLYRCELSLRNGMRQVNAFIPITWSAVLSARSADKRHSFSQRNYSDGLRKFLISS
jgi:hypothetical protein